MRAIGFSPIAIQVVAVLPAVALVVSQVVLGMRKLVAVTVQRLFGRLELGEIVLSRAGVVLRAVLAQLRRVFLYGASGLAQLLAVLVYVVAVLMDIRPVVVQVASVVQRVSARGSLAEARQHALVCIEVGAVLRGGAGWAARQGGVMSLIGKTRRPSGVGDVRSAVVTGHARSAALWTAHVPTTAAMSQGAARPSGKCANQARHRKVFQHRTISQNRAEMWNWGRELA